MQKILSWIAAILNGKRGRPDEASSGFLYVSPRQEGPIRAAAAGAVIENPDSRPPWIVVEHSIESIIAAEWPGRLWQVDILKTAPEQPVASAGYTRAVAVRIVDEVPLSALFGTHGESVAAVIDRAMILTLDDARLLQDAIHPLARAAYSSAWLRWLGRNPRMDPAVDHALTLAVSGTPRSPVGCGFSVLYSVVSDRARIVSGDEAFRADEEEDLVLEPPWGNAAGALLHAVMAFGAPELTSHSDHEALLAAWTELERNQGQP